MTKFRVILQGEEVYSCAALVMGADLGNVVARGIGARMKLIGDVLPGEDVFVEITVEKRPRLLSVPKVR